MNTTIDMIAQLAISLGLLLFLAHILLSMIGSKKVIPNLVKGLLKAFGDGISSILEMLVAALIWLIRWFFGGIRDLIVALARAITGGRRPPPRRRRRRRAP